MTCQRQVQAIWLIDIVQHTPHLHVETSHSQTGRRDTIGSVWICTRELATADRGHQMLDLWLLIKGEVRVHLGYAASCGIRLHVWQGWQRKFV